jgi:predicted O-methyltransferase YrrM
MIEHRNIEIDLPKETDIDTEYTICNYNIENLMVTPEEISIILHFCGKFKNPRVLEIGTWMGVSASKIAKFIKPHGGTLTTVDIVGFNQSLPAIQKEQSLEVDEIGILIPKEVMDIVKKVIILPYTDISKNPRIIGDYDVIFIDGDHSYEGVKKDYEAVKEWSKVILIHDVYWDNDANGISGPLKLLEEVGGYVINNTNLARLIKQV